MAKKTETATTEKSKSAAVLTPREYVKPKEQAPIKNRYGFVMLFECVEGNYNGDPAAGNLPRTDAMTGHGFLTDVCQKRKIRNYVDLVAGKKPGGAIFVKDGSILNVTIEQGYTDLGIDINADLPNGEARRKKGTGQNGEVETVRQRMCESFWDIRTFGAVLSTGPNAGQVTGPLQITNARSYDPVDVLEPTITRCAVTSQAESDDHNGSNQTMGKKYFVPYALFRTYGFVNAARAQQTGFGQDDLDLLWDSLQNMWEHDRSASRGMMSLVKLVIFKHASPLGNAHDNDLFARIKVRKNTETPREIGDYDITIDKDRMPAGVEMMVL